LAATHGGDGLVYCFAICLIAFFRNSICQLGGILTRRRRRARAVRVGVTRVYRRWLRRCSKQRGRHFGGGCRQKAAFRGHLEKRALVRWDEEHVWALNATGTCARGRFSKAAETEFQAGQFGLTRRLGELPGELGAQFVARGLRLVTARRTPPGLLVPRMCSPASKTVLGWFVSNPGRNQDRATERLLERLLAKSTPPEKTGARSGLYR